MPELPEVETTRRGIEPYVVGQPIKQLIIRQPQLRWPIPTDLPRILSKQTIDAVDRRGKYLLFHTRRGTALWHLGMSGHLRVLPSNTPAEKHDHVDVVFSNNTCLRFRDPRRFGALLWTADDPYQHKLLNKLGPEPLTRTFNNAYLWQKTRGRKQAIKTFIMDSHIIVGVGNIYANEALFLAGIKPKRQTHKLTQAECELLVNSIKQTLRRAIRAGGTTLKDFLQMDGQPGYFAQKLHVYGREGEACHSCGATIKHSQISNRSTYYCPGCQT